MNTEHILFLGDSLTDGGDWPRLLGVANISNHGIPGETTRDILRRLHTVIQEEADKIFFMAGINDLAQGMAPKEIASNTEKIVSELGSAYPDAVIYVQSVLPVNHQYFPEAPSLAMIQATNELLAELNDSSTNVHFYSIYASFLDEEGQMKAEFTDDGVHLTPAGYIHWAEQIRGFAL